MPSAPDGAAGAPVPSTRRTILILGRFMRHAPVDFSEGHSIVTWARYAKGKSNSLGLCRQLLRDWNPARLDMVVCNAFGRGYGSDGGRGKSRWALVVKAFVEHGWVSLLLWLMRKRPIPLALVDNSDDIILDSQNRRLSRAATLIFKRELPWDPFLVFDGERGALYKEAANRIRMDADRRRIVSRLRPLALGPRGELPLASKPGGMDQATRRFDVFFAGGVDNRPMREPIPEAIKELARRGRHVHHPEFALSAGDYQAALGGARLALSPPGLGWDCHRHYEAAACGAIPVMPYPNIRPMVPFRHGENCLYYDPGYSLPDQIEPWLDQPEKLRVMGRSAWTLAREHGSHRAIFDSVVRQTIEAASPGGTG